MDPDLPGGRVVDPAAADHGRDDADRVQLLGWARERVAREDDEVGKVAGEQLAPAVLVTGEPGRIDGGGHDRLLDGERLLRVPGGAVVDRALHTCADAGERIELLDRRIGTVRDERNGDEVRVDETSFTRVVRPKALDGSDSSIAVFLPCE